MTLDDLEDERQESTVFTYKNGQLQILVQVLVMVMGYKVEIWKVRGKRNARIVDCTLAQKIEMETALELFFNHYEQELNI